jgi:hypothetical protein
MSSRNTRQQPEPDRRRAQARPAGLTGPRRIPAIRLSAIAFARGTGESLDDPLAAEPGVPVLDRELEASEELPGALAGGFGGGCNQVREQDGLVVDYFLGTAWLAAAGAGDRQRPAASGSEQTAETDQPKQ